MLDLWPQEIEIRCLNRHRIFFIRLARALELTHNIASTTNSIEGLDSLLDPSSVEQALEQAGVAILRMRRLPLEMMLRCVISMAFFRRLCV
ncbi:transposase domain-containing protein [Pseudomonas sp.]|uniref:transposase domain-containing protein n=1 Tax=Pseudomonas sp. TaxID=306 RepID=UPI00286B595E|nr:transposase domain-containing protein [Pseudomonas sp.]